MSRLNLAILPAVASVLGTGLFTPAAIVATLAVFAAQTLNELKKAKEERGKATFSYVPNVERAIK